MGDLLSQIPEWIKWIIGIITSGGVGGASVHKWYKTKLEADQQDFNQGKSLREELRQDLDSIKKRQEEYEIELAQSREKYFEMQEKYHELKLNHEEALRENKRLREEIKKLRDEIKMLREKLDK